MFDNAADWHRVVPLPITTGPKLVVSFQNVTVITEILYDSAVRKSSAWGGVARVTSVFWLIWRLTNYPGKETEYMYKTLAQYVIHFKGFKVSSHTYVSNIFNVSA